MNTFSATNLPRRIKLCQMGPRDGLQNEAGRVATADKIRYVDLLCRSGLSVIETTAFVSKAVPRIREASRFIAGVLGRPLSSRAYDALEAQRRSA